MAEREKGRECIERGRAVILEIYGEEHAVMQKYYSFISLQESIEDKTEALKFIGTKQLEHMQKVNQKSSGDETKKSEESIFLLEAYYDSISILSETEKSCRNAIKDYIE